MEHGGGMPWIPGTYDPALNLYYFGTGNPNPVYDGRSRVGDDLWTCSIVALNPDTGKMAWSFQASPHDTHDWDAVETPVLFNATVAGQPRRLFLCARPHQRPSPGHGAVHHHQLDAGHQTHGPAAAQSGQGAGAAGHAGSPRRGRRHQLASA